MTLQALFKAISERQAIENLDELADLSLELTGVADLAAASADKVAFIAQPKYLDALAQCQAGVVLVSSRFADKAREVANMPLIIVKDAYLAYACISGLFAKQPVAAGIHPTAIIDTTAVIAEGVSIGAQAVIGAGVVIGQDSQIGAHCVIGDHSTLGERCVLYPQVNIADGVRIGNDVRIHSHASIGSEGFGFAPYVENGVRWQRIAQLGGVVIGDRVRIGSNTCIDRGAVGDTVISDDVIIDNLVQIAHNVQVGAGTAMAAKVGIAGSTTIGRGCIIGGSVGIGGHLHIADGVTLTGMTMVISDIKQAGTYSSGTVAMPSANWRRAALKFRKMGDK